ncbi:hypothetical protein ES703_114154 [subsurface metagenome]
MIDHKAFVLSMSGYIMFKLLLEQLERGRSVKDFFTVGPAIQLVLLNTQWLSYLQHPAAVKRFNYANLVLGLEFPNPKDIRNIARQIHFIDP